MDLESHAAQLRQMLAERNAANQLLIKRQRTELSACSSGRPSRRIPRRSIRLG